MSSDYSGASSWFEEEVPICKCKHRASKGTTRREGKNLRRRFFRCRFNGTSKDCKFFRWIDDEFPERAKVVIDEYFAKGKALEEEVHALKVQVSQLCFGREHTTDGTISSILVGQLGNLDKKLSDLTVWCTSLCCISVLILSVAIMLYFLGR